MGTISSGIGLISGIDIAGTVEQLLALEAQPRDRLIARMGTLDAQRTAYLDISARISALLARVSSLSKRSFFTSSKVKSSDTGVISVTADKSVTPGSHSFIVKSLATTHQLVSRGYASADTRLAPGVVSIESSRARANRQVRLEELNGFQGVQRGSFKLIDGTGSEAVISLADAANLADVVDKINQAGINVQAEVRGEGLVLTETTGSTLRVREMYDGHTAADLGFGPGKTYDSGGRIEGDSLIYLADSTPIATLNDAIGVRRAKASGDFTINGITIELNDLLKTDTRIERLNHGRGVELGRIKISTQDEAGQLREQEIDLSGYSTVGQIQSAINGALDGVTVSLHDNQMAIGYASGGDDKMIKVEDLSGHAARDLGILGESGTGKIDGAKILNVDSLGDVIHAINYATGNDGSVTAAIDDTRLVINGGEFVDFAAIGNSKALFDLGFSEGLQTGASSGRRIIGGFSGALLSSLNGGQGFEPGRINIQVGANNVTLDLSDTETLQEVVARINEASQTDGLGIEARFDQSGRRLVIDSLDGLDVQIADVAGFGSFAADLGLALDQPASQIRGSDLQLQYVSEASSLSDLNGGRGINLGEIAITNSRGLTATLDLSVGNVETLQDVIDRINSLTTGSGDSLNVSARINDTGDGILIEDTAGGSTALKIADNSGSTASDLNILGEFQDGSVDGTYAINIELTGNETLSEVVSKINEQSGLATATILNDGTGIAPYRLQISSATTGLRGELLVDGLDFTTLARAQDAKVVLGSDPDSGMLITSSTNTLTNLVPGLTVDLTGVSDDPVTVTVTRDTESIVETFNGFITDFNTAMKRIDEFGSYDAETETRGVLLGEGTLQLIARRMNQLVTQRAPEPVGDLRRLGDIGIRYRNGELEFDEQKLRTALEEKPDALADFFADEENGLAALMKEQLEAITDTGGLIGRREDTLERQKEVISDRVDSMNERLERKRTRLLQDFYNMESALAEMQSQQGALQSLASLASSYST